MALFPARLFADPVKEFEALVDSAPDLSQAIHVLQTGPAKFEAELARLPHDERYRFAAAYEAIAIKALNEKPVRGEWPSGELERFRDFVTRGGLTALPGFSVLGVRAEKLASHVQHTSRRPSFGPSLAPPPARPAPSLPTEVTSAIPRAELEQAIGENLTKVFEFHKLKELAKKHGLRAYLFGGTAASYAHYVKWDLERQKGDTSYQPERFNYDFNNIFRFTQDIDIVVDGTPSEVMAKAAAFEKDLKREFPYVTGEKNAWEVRLLRQPRGTHEALLGNPDFLNQHSDSNSTGLIEVTDPPSGEPRVHDIRDWDSRYPAFFEDVRTGTLHYYYSDKHKSTPRYSNGINPEIFSVIRYFTKAFQFGLKIPDEDRAKLERVIREFNPSVDIRTPQAAAWIEKNGKKLFQHATDLEYAWDTLEKNALRAKLVGMGNRLKRGAMAWWLNKKPLASRPVGEGTGRTAKELGLKVLAHDTTDYMAFESITRSPKGLPNVFISRAGFPHESADLGDGFYTLSGQRGAAARWKGYTVHLELDPNAREGTDFKYVRSGIGIAEWKTVIILNKNAVRIIPDRLAVGAVQFYENLGRWRSWDKKLLPRVLRSVRTQLRAATNEDKDHIAQALARYLPRWFPPAFLDEAIDALAVSPLSPEQWVALAEKLAYGQKFSTASTEAPLGKLLVQSLSRTNGVGEYLSLLAHVEKGGRAMRNAAFRGVAGRLDDFLRFSPTFEELKALHDFVSNETMSTWGAAILRRKLAGPMRRAPVTADSKAFDTWRETEPLRAAGDYAHRFCRRVLYELATKAAPVVAGTYGLYWAGRKFWNWTEWGLSADEKAQAKLEREIGEFPPVAKEAYAWALQHPSEPFGKTKYHAADFAVGVVRREKESPGYFTRFKEALSLVDAWIKAKAIPNLSSEYDRMELVRAVANHSRLKGTFSPIAPVISHFPRLYQLQLDHPSDYFASWRADRVLKACEMLRELPLEAQELFNRATSKEWEIDTKEALELAAGVSLLPEAERRPYADLFEKAYRHALAKGAEAKQTIAERNEGAPKGTLAALLTVLQGGGRDEDKPGEGPVIRTRALSFARAVAAYGKFPEKPDDFYGDYLFALGDGVWLGPSKALRFASMMAETPALAEHRDLVRRIFRHAITKLHEGLDETKMFAKEILEKPDGAGYWKRYEASFAHFNDTLSIDVAEADQLARKFAEMKDAETLFKPHAQAYIYVKGFSGERSVALDFARKWMRKPDFEEFLQRHRVAMTFLEPYVKQEPASLHYDLAERLAERPHIGAAAALFEAAHRFATKTLGLRSAAALSFARRFLVLPDGEGWLAEYKDLYRRFTEAKLPPDQARRAATEELGRRLPAALWPPVPSAR